VLPEIREFERTSTTAVCAEKRLGSTWRVEPALRDIAYMQIEDFQQASNLKSVKEVTAFPMLAGNGVTQSVDANGDATTVPVGPKAVLFAPMGADGKFGKWEFIEPSSQSLTFLKADLEAHRARRCATWAGSRWRPPTSRL
jgi:hypothetical protein